MRILQLLTIVAGCTLTAVSAQAVENFIPQGHSYSNTSRELPKLGSAAEKFDLQADIYETEIYRKAYEKRVFESHMRRFISNRNRQPGNYSVDY